MRGCALLLLAGILLPPCALAQAARPPASDPFAPYISCQPRGGPNIVDVTPLAAGIQERTVDTRKGPAQIAMADGRRIMFAYPGEDFYANMKVEILDAAQYAQSKSNLIENFDYILASGDNTRNYALAPMRNGFESYALDRTRKEGGVLGIYLLFDNTTRTVVTIYFLNQEPPQHFKSMAEYATLRDNFLTGYTSCVREKLSAAR